MKRTGKPSNRVICACLAVALLLSMGLVGCTGGKTLEGSDREAVLAYSEPIADNLFQGMNSSDYEIFSRDFDDAMLNAISAQTFTDSFIPTIVGKLGKYVSRQVSSVTEIGSNVLVIYTARFEQDNNVTIRLSLEQASPHHVAGLFFNSPKLK